MSDGFVKAVDEGILGQILNFALEKGFGIPALVSNAARVVNNTIEGAVAGVSGFASNIGERSISSSPKIEAPQEKVGMNAQPERVAARYAMENDQNHAYNNNVQVPVTQFDKILQLEGIQV